jgi:hypothetical protein
MDQKTVDALLQQVIKHNESIIEDLRKLERTEELWILLDSIREDQHQIEDTIKKINELSNERENHTKS